MTSKMIFFFAAVAIWALPADPVMAADGHMESLADDYASGRGVVQDDAKAVALYRKAAAAGNASAEGKLGAMIANCRGTRCDDAAGAAWLKRAADAGDASAQFNLGVMYADGRGLPMDQPASLRWRTKAAEQGLAVALRDLGDLLTSKSDAADVNRGVAYYERLADAGDPDAAYRAGHVLERRSYCGREQRASYLRSAITWLEKAAAHGDPRADLDLARIYDHTTPLFDRRTSRAWWEKASADGSAEATYYLGMMAHGDGAALGLYLKAAKGGYLYAAQALSRMYADPKAAIFDRAASAFWSAEYTRLAALETKPTKFPDDYERTQRVILDANQTFDWYRRAAARGNPVAAYGLGIMYLGGLDVDIDDAEAEIWLSKASAHGIGDADAVLGDIYAQGEQAKPLALYKRAARHGIVRAQVKLGDLLRLDGFRWSLAAARHGSAEGARQVGEDYADNESCGDRGRKPACNPALAMKWLRVAADGGDVEAQFEVAQRTDGASTLDPRRNAAIALFRRASDNGSAEAADRLGWIYSYGREPGDRRQALRFYMLAAERGRFAAAAKVAGLYEALGEPQQAFEWYRKAGDYVKVGRAYEEGIGVAKDPATARHYYLKGAQNGFADAQYRLGRLYADGVGGPVDVPLAYELFTLSSMGGSEGAASAGYDRSQFRDAADARKALAARLTPPQIAAATASASSWRVGQPLAAGVDAEVLDLDGAEAKRQARRTRCS